MAKKDSDNRKKEREVFFLLKQPRHLAGIEEKSE